MNINNLELDKEYKNKSEICKLLGVKKATGGRNIKLQDMDFSRYFRLEKTTGNKVKVVEIYVEALHKVDGRKGNSGKSEGSRNNYKGIYAEIIDALLLQYLQKELLKLRDTCKIYTTNNKIAEATGIVNYNYRTAFSNQGKFYNTVKKDFDIKSNTYCMRDVFDMVKTKIREIVRASLDRLQKAEQLEYNPCYFVYMSHVSRPPNESELDTILAAEKDIMREMGVEHKKQIDNNQKLSKEFNTNVLKKIQEKFSYIEGIYKGYTIVLWEDFELKSEIELKGLIKKLNNLIIESLRNKPVKLQETTKEERGDSWFGSRNPFWKPWVYDRLSNKYIEHCYEFIYILCNIDANDISKQIINCKNNKIINGLTQKQREGIHNNIAIKLIDKLGFND